MPEQRDFLKEFKEASDIHNKTLNEAKSKFTDDIKKATEEIVNKKEELEKEYSAAIAQAEKELLECTAETGTGLGKIIKAWAKVIKNDNISMNAVLSFATDNNLIQVYCSAIEQGLLWRMCYRTFIVNQYIYNMIRESNKDSEMIEDFLNSIDEPERGEGQ